MLNSTSPAGSDTEAELAHTRHIQDVSGYDSDSASLIGTPSRRRSRPSRMSVMSMSSVSSASSLSTLTPEPMGFQARRKRAAKLTNFFGASYRDLFGEVLERLEIGFLEEAREGNMSPQEIDVRFSKTFISLRIDDGYRPTYRISWDKSRPSRDGKPGIGRIYDQPRCRCCATYDFMTLTPHDYMPIFVFLGLLCALVALYSGLVSLVPHIFHRIISADCDTYCGFPLVSYILYS